MNSKNLEISPCSEEKVTSRARQRETNSKLFRPSTKTKRMPFLKHENSTTPIQLVALQRAGTKFVSYARVTFSSNRRMVAKKSWFGWPAEIGTKTRHCQERGHQRAFQPKIYATNTARCPVSFYKKFHSHQPVEMNASESPFYSAVSGIINAQMKKFGMWRHRSEKIKYNK